jgi:hypothetical protein
MAETSETRTYNSLLSTTLENYRPVLHDNIFKDNVVLFWLGMNDKKRTEDGGERVRETLLYGKNNTVQNYNGYDVLNVTPQEGMTIAYFDWKQMAVSIAISRLEERQNSGKHRLLNLLEAKTMQAEMSLKEEMNRQLIGDYSTAASENNGGDTLPLQLSGLARFVQKAPEGAYSVGGINQSVASNSWWRNQEVDAGLIGDFAASNAGLASMRSMYNLCSEGNDHPDFILSDRETFEVYEGMIVGYLRYLDTRYGDAGFVNLRYKGAVVTYDSWFENMTVPQTYSTDQGVMLFLNSKYISFVVDKETDLITTDFVRPTNQDARVAQILLMAELTSGNRRRLGILHEISNS